MEMYTEINNLLALLKTLQIKHNWVFQNDNGPERIQFSSGL